MLLVVSCATGPRSRATVDNKMAEYKPVNPESIREAKILLDDSRVKNSETIKKGKERSSNYKPLMLNLVAFHEHGYELKLSDVSPYLEELPEISAIFTSKDVEDFAKHEAQGDLSTKVLYAELEKAESNNQADKDKDAKIRELQDKLDSEYVRELINLATKFMWAGGILFSCGILSGVPSLAPFVAKAKVTGLSLLGIGGAIMLIGHFLDLAKQFFDDYGQWLLLLLLVPLIVIFVGKKGHSAYEEIKDGD